MRHPQRSRSARRSTRGSHDHDGLQGADLWGVRHFISWSRHASARSQIMLWRAGLRVQLRSAADLKLRRSRGPGRLLTATIVSRGIAEMLPAESFTERM